MPSNNIKEGNKSHRLIMQTIVFINNTRITWSTNNFMPIFEFLRQFASGCFFFFLSFFFYMTFHKKSWYFWDSMENMLNSNLGCCSLFSWQFDLICILIWCDLIWFDLICVVLCCCVCLFVFKKHTGKKLQKTTSLTLKIISNITT